MVIYLSKIESAIILLLQQAISIVAGYNFDELIIKTNVFIDEYHDI